MTLDEVKALSNSEINRIIAEWMGWTLGYALVIFQSEFFKHYPPKMHGIGVKTKDVRNFKKLIKYIRDWQNTGSLYAKHSTFSIERCILNSRGCRQTNYPQYTSPDSPRRLLEEVVNRLYNKFRDDYMEYIDARWAVMNVDEKQKSYRPITPRQTCEALVLAIKGWDDWRK